MDFEVLNGLHFCYGKGRLQSDLMVMTKGQRDALKEEARKYREGACVFVRVSDIWCPLVSEDTYEDVWSGEVKPILGAPIGCYGIARGSHNPRDRKLALDALYEEYTKNASPHPKERLIGNSIKKALLGSLA